LEWSTSTSAQITHLNDEVAALQWLLQKGG
jgi:hypothetical protein